MQVGFRGALIRGNGPENRQSGLGSTEDGPSNQCARWSVQRRRSVRELVYVGHVYCACSLQHLVSPCGWTRDKHTHSQQQTHGNQKSQHVYARCLVRHANGLDTLCARISHIYRLACGSTRASRVCKQNAMATCDSTVNFPTGAIAPLANRTLVKVDCFVYTCLCSSVWQSIFSPLQGPEIGTLVRTCGRVGCGYIRCWAIAALRRLRQWQISYIVQF